LDFNNTNAYASFTHQIFGKQLELFGDFLYANDHNLNFLNAQPLSNGTGVVILGSTRVDPLTGGLVPENRGAPAAFNPFQLSIDANTNSGRFRLTAANRYQQAPRTFTNDSNFYRFLGGLRSQITPDWTAEAATYYSHYAIDFVNSGLVNATQLNAAIAGTATDANGDLLPAFDFFARNPIGTGPGQLTPGQFATLFGNNIRKLDSYQEVFDGRVSGFPFSLPGGKVGISVGGEYRVEGFKVQDSPEIFVGSVPIQEINTSRSIQSVYAELSVPIVGPTMEVPFVYSLEVNLAGRYDHYEGLSEDAKVPKVTLRYQPIKDLTLRATYSNSFVAPTLYQLYGPASQGFSSSISFNGSQEDQAQVRTGSNPNLVPSKAESYTAGMVYSPSFVPGLVLSADYFRTLQQQIVSTLGGSTILVSVNNSGPASPYASLVSFNAFPGSPGARAVSAGDLGPNGYLSGNLASTFYLDTNINIGAVRVEGFDLSARYNLDLQRYGQAEFGINSVVFTKNDQKRTPQSHYFNNSGLDFPEGGGGNPDYKLTFLFEYRFQGATLSLNANYIPELLNAVGRDPETEDQSTFDPIEDYISVDGRLAYTFKGKTTPGAVVDSKDSKSMMDGKSGGGGVAGAPEMSPIQRLLDGTTVAVGCNNIFDEDPRYVNGANSATDLSIYDPFGRFVYFEISKKF
jgi:iron complex outermembrane receptor protein